MYSVACDHCGSCLRSVSLDLHWVLYVSLYSRRVELGIAVFGHCAILDEVKTQVGLKMKDTGGRSYPESDSVE